MSVIDAKEKSLVSPSSSLLDMHLSELEEECRNFVSLISALRSLAENDAPDEDEPDEDAEMEERWTPRFRK